MLKKFGLFNFEKGKLRKNIIAALLKVIMERIEAYLIQVFTVEATGCNKRNSYCIVGKKSQQEEQHIQTLFLEN